MAFFGNSWHWCLKLGNNLGYNEKKAIWFLRQLFFKGLPFYFKTVPLMYKAFTGVLAFERIVTILLKGVACAALNVTLILPDSPGLTGVWVYSGTVQPQVDSTLLMIRGSAPVFSNLNS